MTAATAHSTAAPKVAKVLSREPGYGKLRQMTIIRRARSAALSLTVLAAVGGTAAVAASASPAQAEAATASQHFTTVAKDKGAKLQMCLDGITVLFRLDARKSSADGYYQVDVNSPSGTHYGHEEAWYEHRKGKVRSAGGFSDPTTLVKVKLGGLGGPVHVKKKFAVAAIPAC